jgi:osmotically inducible protein OsmC
MAAVMSRAEIRWQGSLRDGSGELQPASGAFGPLQMTFAAREHSTPGKTNPEELIAAAHATCFAMAFSNTLAQAGSPPNMLHVTATASLDRVDGALKITRIDLTVQGDAPGVEPAKFEEMARAAEQRCPVSNALRNNVEIRLDVQPAVVRA